MIGESAYLELMKGCSQWNERMNKEKTPRLPFFDQQTHIAQQASRVRFNEYERQVLATADGSIYAYNSAEWLRPSGARSLAQMLNIKQAVTNEQNSAENSAAATEGPELERQIVEKEVSRYLELEEMSESGEEPFDQSDAEDYEETYSRRRGRGRGAGKRSAASAAAGSTPHGPPRARRRTTLPNSTIEHQQLTPQTQTSNTDSKPHKCQLCSAGYKTKAGLNYHMHHVHSAQADSAAKNHELSVTPTVQANKDCDFCLGDAAENKRSGKAEDLVACHDCGRAGHPTCLNFTSNMLTSTKKYGWQCIECKSCAICGTSDNDDVLLFCDDCDRGFHLYCLQPPLQHAPEGEWSCQLCQVAFGTNASKPSAAHTKPNACSGTEQAATKQE